MEEFSPIVSVKWLKDNLDNKNLIILDATIPKVVGNASTNTKKQIPNSTFFDIKKVFSDTKARFSNTIPSEEQFTIQAQKLGINTNSHIIVYDSLGIYSSPRAYWLFKVFGHKKVSVLNGGLPEWIANNYATETSIETNNINTNIGDFKAKLNQNSVVYFKDLKQLINNNDALILDARSADRFKAEVPEPRAGLRSGTIPNSKNLPFTTLLDKGKFKSKEELQAVFSNFANKNKQIVFSCGSGITACTLELAATISGYSNLAVYDGSWTEYGSLTTHTMNTPTEWTKQELVAYILLYIANADLHETNDEKDFILSKVDRETFAAVHEVFDKDNDYQCIQKIIEGVKSHDYFKDDYSELFTDIKLMLYADGEAEEMEETTFMYLKKILK